MAERTYYQEKDMKNIETIRRICADLPDYVSRFQRGISQTTSTLSRVGYARDIKAFMQYICDVNDLGDDLKQVTLQMLSDIDTEFVEIYIDYLTQYEKDGRIITNGKASIKRKLSSLSVFYKYLYKNDMISENVFAKVDKPKLKEKNIIRMDPAETANFVDAVEFGNTLSEHQQKYHEKTKYRDLALLSLMLSTGIRISECIGLNLNDVDFDNMCIRVTRKGGKEAIVYFSDEAGDALYDYIIQRKKIDAQKGHENALFLSSQNRRISVRAVENMVEKYSKGSVPLKHITPHKLRSTFGSTLYQETNDIYLVADVLGHSDVNTTRKHYADIENDMKRRARNTVTLREKPINQENPK
jgi:integrase/recombinase XerC